MGDENNHFAVIIAIRRYFLALRQALNDIALKANIRSISKPAQVAGNARLLMLPFAPVAVAKRDAA